MQGQKKLFIYNPTKPWVKKTELISKVPLHLVPEQDEDLEVGNLIQFKDNNDNEIKETVTHISDKTVTVDANHPLTGEALTFDIELIELLWCFFHFHDIRVACRSSG